MEETEQNSNEHQLWVNLSSQGEGNIFAHLPELLKRMFAAELAEDDGPEDEFEMVLASDHEWRFKIYYRLLAKMKNEEGTMLVPCREEEEVVNLHHWNIVPKETKVKCYVPARRAAKKVTHAPTPITWTVEDIYKAACLLANPPMPTSFEDEQEMRRVYTLIYDTFRYKGILAQALNDVTFYQIYPQLQKLSPQIWLLFFDFYHRSFKKRESAVIESATNLFNKIGLMAIENALWNQRIKLAAAVARLRIENSALSLSDLLPKHLRDDRLHSLGVSAPVTCWINPHRVKHESDVLTTLEKILCVKKIDNDKSLSATSYQWDLLCPNFINFHHSLRAVLARTYLVQKHKLIVQDRSFCIGPATFGKIVHELELTGSVIQSHINSPRTTAYLAMLLSRNSRINTLLVFGAGNKLEEYKDYLRELGTKNVSIHAERLIDLPPDSNCLEHVIAVFATPPNSYSAVADPIDLVCSRGGDLSMLEILTESEITPAGRERVASILEEQRKTLRFAMSRPQIQLVLYETHSELEIENEDMVDKTMKEMNKLAKFRHAVLQGKIKSTNSQTELFLQDAREINNNETIKVEIIPSDESILTNTSKRQSMVSQSSMNSLEAFDKMYKDVVVPNCDIFDKPMIPDLCPNTDSCLKLTDEGCYLALIQRKEVTKLDNKYMIQMAEIRGLFGSTSSASGRTKGSRGSKSKKQEKRAASPSINKNKKTLRSAELARIAAPTEASLRQANVAEVRCPKSVGEDEPLSKVPESRRWWSETTRHLTNLRQSLVNKNILPVKKSCSQPIAKRFANTLAHATNRIDEIVARSSDNYQIPVFPRLRLSRNAQRVDKIPLPVTVTLVKFPETFT